MTIPPISGVMGPHAADSPEKIKDAASQFEALLIGQILKTEHDDSGDGWGGESDPASGSAMDFANDYFARAMASKGGLGLSTMIVNGLNRQAAASAEPRPAVPE
jgi:Rod binding domain-containing protein